MEKAFELSAIPQVQVRAMALVLVLIQPFLSEPRPALMQVLLPS